MNQNGKLFLVATPLGNLEDITLRALRILKEVNLIAAEDTRHTIKLLNYYQIKKKLVSCYQFNERERKDEIINLLLQGESIALVSDAGTPGISDPGNLLVIEAIKNGIAIIPIPGPSAVITALAASGLDTGSFCFEGFLPRKLNEQLIKLQKLSRFEGTLVFYEAPHRVIRTLKNILKVFGDRQVVLARELTKIHEEFVRGYLTQIIAKLENVKLIGEFTIVIEGFHNNVENWENKDELVDFEQYDDFNSGKGTIRERLRLIAKKSGKSTREMYRLYLANQKRK